MTINQHPSVSHVDQFCLTEGHVNCQRAIKRPTTHRSMTSVERNTIVPATRGTGNNSHTNVCSHSSPTLPHSQVHHPERLLIVLMTTQHVTVTTKLICPPAHIRQHCVQVHCARPPACLAAEFQVVAAVLMLNMSRRDKWHSRSTHPTYTASMLVHLRLPVRKRLHFSCNMCG